MKEYTWTVESVDPAAATMVVCYEHAGMKSSYNIPMPPEGEDLGSWVSVYAPTYDWERMAAPMAAVEVGATGTAVFGQQVQPETENANVVGNWNEEYLRAMIYQVLEEVRESEV